MRFQDPQWLLLVPAVLALLWASHRRARRREGSIGYSDLQLVRWSSAARPAWESHLPLALLAAALVLGLIALARPQAGVARTTTPTSGVDIVLALDTSTSMAADDLLPNRLEAARQVSMGFVQARPRDRIGLVVYGGTALTQCPLTGDHPALQTLLEEVELGSTGIDGTAVGAAIATSVNRLKTSDARSKVIILVTDGRSNVGEVEPLAAAELAAATGIRIYTIGVGAADPLAWPGMAEADVDEETLTAVAQATDGEYFRAADNASLANIYREIDRLERTELPARTTIDYHELCLGFLFPAALLAAAGMLLDGTVLKEVP